jgi:hypothetical protein
LSFGRFPRLHTGSCAHRSHGISAAIFTRRPPCTADAPEPASLQLQHGDGEIADVDGGAGVSARARHFQVVETAASVCFPA